jgi:hypothetical protein
VRDRGSKGMDGCPLTRWASSHTASGIRLGLREDIIDMLRLRDRLRGFRYDEVIVLLIWFCIVFSMFDVFEVSINVWLDDLFSLPLIERIPIELNVLIIL